MDEDRRELRSADILIVDHRIARIGVALDLEHPAAETIDLSGHIVCPGLINTHHHMFQSLTRVIPAAQDSSLFGWLRTLYPIWSRLTPEMIHVSTQTAMAELLLSGCTTSSDHLYLYPNGARLDDSIAAAVEIGMRFHAARGSMSIGESHGRIAAGLPGRSPRPTSLRDTRRVIEAFHDPHPSAMVRIIAAPCSPFSVSEGLMRDTADLARQYGVRLHTHLAENDDDVAYSLERFGATPARYAENLGWLGSDVWHAHCVKLDGEGIGLFADSSTGVAHCPCSNMRLGSGRGADRRHAETAVWPSGWESTARRRTTARACSARRVRPCCCSGWSMARPRSRRGTRSNWRRWAARRCSAATTSVGSRSAWRRISRSTICDRSPSAGALADPVAALVFCGPIAAAYTIVHGKVVVREGRLSTVDARALTERHNRLAARLLNG